MIDPRELRIGNKVKVTIGNDAGIYEVLGIPMWGMDGCGDGVRPLVMIDRCPKQLVAPEKLRGIRLTNEILYTCGFKDCSCGGVKIDGLHLKLDKQTKTLQFENMIVNRVHKLQNLFFALTGNELEIKL